MPISPDRTPRRRRSTVILLAAGLSAGVAVPTLLTGQTGSISDQREQVAQLQAQLDEANVEAERATEAYNGAQYELDLTKQRIQRNADLIVGAQTRLVSARERLAQRLRDLYATPPPSLVQVVVDSGSVTDAVDSVQLFQRVGERDGRVVDGIRTDLSQLKTARVELEHDRVAAKQHLADAEQHKAEVEAALARHQELLDGAKGELRRLLEAEQRRQAAAAALERQRAEAAQAAVASATSAPAAEGGTGTPQAAATYAPVGSGAGNSAVVGIAMQYLGVPYVWGGASPSGFDCSGLASYVYGRIGKSVPHYTGAIWAAFPKVTSGDLQPGDLVFFRADLGHMGIYIGGGQFIHAPHTGDVVKVSSLGERSDYAGAVRP